MVREDVRLRFRIEDVNSAAFMRKPTRLLGHYKAELGEVGRSSDVVGRKHGWIRQAAGDVSRLAGAVTPIYAVHQAFSLLFDQFRREWDLWESRRKQYADTAVEAQAARAQALSMTKVTEYGRMDAPFMEGLAASVAAQGYAGPQETWATIQRAVSVSGTLSTEQVTGATLAGLRLSQALGPQVSGTELVPSIEKMMRASDYADPMAGVGLYRFFLGLAEMQEEQFATKYLPKMLQVAKLKNIPIPTSVALGSLIGALGMDPEGAKATTAQTGLLRSLWEGQVPREVTETAWHPTRGWVQQSRFEKKARMPFILTPEGEAPEAANRAADALYQLTQQWGDTEEAERRGLLGEMGRQYQQVFGEEMPVYDDPKTGRLDPTKTLAGIQNRLVEGAGFWERLRYVTNLRFTSPKAHQAWMEGLVTVIKMIGGRSEMQAVVKAIGRYDPDVIEELEAREAAGFALMADEPQAIAFGEKSQAQAEARSGLLIRRGRGEARRGWAQVETPTGRFAARQGEALKTLQEWKQILIGDTALEKRVDETIATVKMMTGGDPWEIIFNTLLPDLRQRADLGEWGREPRGMGLRGAGLVGRRRWEANPLYDPDLAQLMYRELFEIASMGGAEEGAPMIGRLNRAMAAEGWTVGAGPKEWPADAPEPPAPELRLESVGTGPNTGLYRGDQVDPTY